MVGATRLDGMQSGEERDRCYFAAMQTLGGDSKTTCMLPKLIKKNERIFIATIPVPFINTSTNDSLNSIRDTSEIFSTSI